MHGAAKAEGGGAREETRGSERARRERGGERARERPHFAVRIPINDIYIYIYIYIYVSIYIYIYIYIFVRNEKNT
jgi:hypothetical protein